MSNFVGSLELTQGLLLSRLMQLEASPPAGDDLGLYARRSLPVRMACFSALVTEPVCVDLIRAKAHERIVDFFDVGVGTGAQLIAQGWQLTQAEGYSLEQSIESIRHSYPLISQMMRLPAPHINQVQEKYGLRNDFADAPQAPLISPAHPGESLAFDGTVAAFTAELQCPFGSRMYTVYQKMVDASVSIDWLLPQEFETMEVA